MSVDREVDFLDRVFVLPGHRQLVNDLGGMSSHDVGAENLAVLLVPDDLHEPLGLAGGPGPAVGTEGEATHLVVELALLACSSLSPTTASSGLV